MARLPRFFVPGLPLHIIQRGNNRDPIFGSPADFAFVHRYMTLAASMHGVAVHAYVLMTNHLHVLATPSLSTSVPRLMQSLGRVYVQYFNWRHRRTGTLWEGRYKATIIEDERCLLSCMRYIELNPVRARMAEEPGGYRWSSFRTNALGEVDRLISERKIRTRRLARPAVR
jgi:putative transposase